MCTGQCLYKVSDVYELRAGLKTLDFRGCFMARNPKSFCMYKNLINTLVLVHLHGVLHDLHACV